MTFCLGARVREGLVGIADTRITSGNEVITARKLSIYQHDRHSMFLMTSGLRSVRDKLVVYFDELLEEEDEAFDKLYKAVNAFGEQIRRVAREDKQALVDSGVSFDVACLVGGQLEHDEEPKLYLLYAQGNWVEVGRGTPYHIIGESGYGKPIIRRALNFDDTLRHALKVGILAFDSTRISAADVDFPIDVVLYRADSYQIVEHRYEHEDLKQLSEFWQDRLRSGIQEMPADWLEQAFTEVPAPVDLQRDGRRAAAGSANR